MHVSLGLSSPSVGLCDVRGDPECAHSSTPRQGAHVSSWSWGLGPWNCRGLSVCIWGARAETCLGSLEILGSYSPHPSQPTLPSYPGQGFPREGQLPTPESAPAGLHRGESLVTKWREHSSGMGQAWIGLPLVPLPSWGTWASDLAFLSLGFLRVVAVVVVVSPEDQMT